MKTLLIATAIAALSMSSVAFAEDDKTTETTTTTTTTGAGTVSTFTPGQSIVVKTTTAAEPVTYRIGEKVTYVDGSGAVVQASAISAGTPVTVHYRKVGSDMMVDRVVVTKTTKTTTED